MKNLMFIFLLVIPFCKAADPDQSWYDAVQHIPNWQQQAELNLDDNQIGAIPDNFNLHNLRYLNLINNQIVAIPNNFNSPDLRTLSLSNNNIDQINPERLLEQFPQLVYLNLSNNPNLHLKNIEDLRDAAARAGRNIEIIANNIRPGGQDIKG